ncbi:hypothetical protein FRACA_10030 [Frankia canadensis]|uniref:Cupin 2 conserved barrel domain-containing protein n=2 Tax=Frankia canadensis TaxID=1836972 RepID=A0A2I2KHY0_9ACTN|nr:hypothetical protein FRACA_10030 [Frankia canadensis]SOU52561.1 hypothetical protein FRACA_10030 [Frankia canadensis]
MTLDSADVPKVAYFQLDVDEGWKQSKPNIESPDGNVPEVVRETADVLEYFRGGLFTRREQVGSLHMLEMKLAPNFVIPRHHHNMDQLVLVLEGRARQGRRWFEPGEGYFTKAMVPYSTAAGPEGCRLVEIRKDRIEDLKIWWDDDNPSHWARSLWDTKLGTPT